MKTHEAFVLMQCEYRVIEEPLLPCALSENLWEHCLCLLFTKPWVFTDIRTAWPFPRINS